MSPTGYAKQLFNEYGLVQSCLELKGKDCNIFPIDESRTYHTHAHKYTAQHSTVIHMYQKRGRDTATCFTLIQANKQICIHWIYLFHLSRTLTLSLFDLFENTWHVILIEWWRKDCLDCMCVCFCFGVFARKLSLIELKVCSIRGGERLGIRAHSIIMILWHQRYALF